MSERALSFGSIAAAHERFRLGYPDAVAERLPYLPDDEVPSPDGTPRDAELRWPRTELVVVHVARRAAAPPG